MILDTLDRLDHYSALHPRFAEAIAFLQALPAYDQLAMGRHEIAGDDLYAMVARADGRGKVNVMETHRRYIDIQVCLEGADCMGWSPIEAVQTSGRGYDNDKDCELYDTEPVTWLTVAPGMFAIFFPEDAHAPLAAEGKDLLKVIVKVRV